MRLPFFPNAIGTNIRTVIDIVQYYEAHLEKQMMLIFLDAEKVFDNVNKLHVDPIKMMGLQGSFFQAVESIYLQ